MMPFLPFRTPFSPSPSLSPVKAPIRSPDLCPTRYHLRRLRIPHSLPTRLRRATPTLSQAPTLHCNVDLSKTLDCARRQSRVWWRSGSTGPSLHLVSSPVGDGVGTKAKTMPSSTNIHLHGSSVEVVLLLLSARLTRVTSTRVLSEPKTTSTGVAYRL
jgi:hypothetical protein